MRGTFIKWVLTTAALAGAGVAAGPAAAATGPACSTRVIAAPVGSSASCHFDSPTDGGLISVVTDGRVTVTLRCNAQYGYTYTTSRTFTSSGAWSARTPGGCQMVLTAGQEGVTANATATPGTPPIYEPYPTPA